MSLIKGPTITSQKAAADRANARLSNGPATPEGLERMRSSKIRHGFYSSQGSEALRVLGEDPEEFGRLFQSLHNAWQPTDDGQQALVKRLARLLWRLDRADRIQESMAVCQVANLERGAARQAQQHAAQRERIISVLGDLQHALERGDFGATDADLQAVKEVGGAEPAGLGKEILVRLCQLMRPATTDPDRPAENESALAITRSPDRDRLRAELQGILENQINHVNAAYEQHSPEELAEALRDVTMIPDQPRAEFLSRKEASDLRQLRCTTELLIKLKAHRREEREERERDWEKEMGIPGSRRK